MANHPNLGDVPRISVDEAKRLFDSGSALFVDVRKTEHHKKLCIAGAVSIPLMGPADRYWELPTDRAIIIY